MRKLVPRGRSVAEDALCLAAGPGVHVLSDLNGWDGEWMELRADFRAPGGAVRALTHIPIIGGKVEVQSGGAQVTGLGSISAEDSRGLH